MKQHGFFEDPEEHKETPKHDKCTPEKLRAFMLRLGHSPTMLELKQEFGGILGAIMDGHTLQKQGLYPTFNKRRQ